MTSYGIQPPDFRLPEETRIGRVRLQVADLERSSDFYTRLLGFAVLDQDDGHIGLGVAGEMEPLIELMPGADGPLTARRLGLYHFAILLPQRSALGSFLDHLLQNGINPGAADHFVSEALYLKDPDGLGIEVYRDRPREEWSVRGRELHMTSAPLDFDAVVAARTEGPWRGMPSDTRIGHIHLHVGDLGAAKDFYHAGLGFDLVVWSYPEALFLSAGGYHHHLGVNTWAGPHAIEAGQTEPKLLNWELVLPGPAAIEAATNSLMQRGHSVTPQEAGGAVATDPWGTSLRLTTRVQASSGTVV